ncbi:DgyrCDS12219 [Dimorphilus gyrociliatus]|uniref:2-(3-amino-3-carboxypropyl)histidine synthase subunit 2 n=1 Tax=Dimorphilus gyrociliatus TaxID=2664684 RepID=A0A7I8W8I2_9ANNE|nr:DgyrCDS12219 [Dimorphilus gyrociliatus]
MTSTFSTDSSAQLLIKSLIAYDAINESEIAEVYEFERTLQWIKENNLKRVALQFPDELLVDSINIYQKLEELCDIPLYLMADTTFGSCCVDEIGAEHGVCDGIIHYGSACLSSTIRFPSLHIFGRRRLDIEDFMKHLKSNYRDNNVKTLIFAESAYTYAVDTILSTVQKEFKNMRSIQSSCHVEGSEGEEGLFIGSEENGMLPRLTLQYNHLQWSTYDPQTKKFLKHSTIPRKLMMKRFHLVEKAKDARIIGILVGTLGVKGYNEALDHIRTLIKKRGKKCYTLAVGKLNPAKLANFPEVDVFVLVACPDTVLIDSKSFYKPVLTMYELELALNSNRDPSAGFEYVAEFSNLLPGGKEYVEASETVEDDECADVSLITGGIRYLSSRTDDSDETSTNQAITTRAPLGVATYARDAGEFLENRSWRGLEQKLGETPVSEIKEGRRGIALGYTHEPS